MNSLTAWGLREVHKKLEKSGNRLIKISGLIDWTPIRQILEEMYDNKSDQGGRPNCDVILMFKILILQQWYGLSDLEIERQISDRISFMGFLGFPDPIPDSRTIWLFRDRMARTGKDKSVWSELQRQLNAKGLKVSLTLVSESLDEVETSKKEQSKMLHLSKPIPDHPRNHAARTQRLAAAETEPGQRKAANCILVINCIPKLIWIMA